MKKSLTVAVLMMWMVLAAGVTGVRADEWYQGQPGMWHREGNNWVWRGKQGDEWFEGHRGHWYAEPNGWYWLSDDGREYRRGPHGWEWAAERHGHNKHHHHHD